MTRSFTESASGLLVMTRSKRAAIHSKLLAKWKNRPDLCFYSVPVEEISMFPQRLVLALKRQRINDVEDLLSMNYKELMLLPNIGSKSEHLIMTFLAQMNQEMFAKRTSK
jgi:DNA-directed RNA polymerase alpha subunit